MQKSEQKRVLDQVLGNLEEGWGRSWADGADLEWLDLDRWSAQKSRFVATSDRGREYRVALERHTQLRNGDILARSEEPRHLLVVRIRMGKVLRLRPTTEAAKHPERLWELAFELGHAVGNQHWPAVVRHGSIFVPLTIDRRVMESVMASHRIEGFEWAFLAGEEVIPYLSPHELRRLFGASEPASKHAHPTHPHSHE